MILEQPYQFETDCVGSDYESIQDLKATEQPITSRQFSHRIGAEQWKVLRKRLGYDRSMPISKDWHVGYYEGVYRGLRAVFLRWSGIEYIFVRRW
jgi:hypothetical protein